MRKVSRKQYDDAKKIVARFETENNIKEGFINLLYTTNKWVAHSVHNYFKDILNIEIDVSSVSIKDLKSIDLEKYRNRMNVGPNTYYRFVELLKTLT
jgi:hypothetical protein